MNRKPHKIVLKFYFNDDPLHCKKYDNWKTFKLIPSNKSNEQSKQEDVVVSTQKQRDTKSKRRDKKAGTSNNKYFFFYIYSEHTK